MRFSRTRKRDSAARRRANRARAPADPNKRVRAQPIIPGTRYLVTRRCAGRRLFMNPDDEVGEKLNQAIGYCLGVTLERYGLDLHAACYESNHKHEVVTDHRGELPTFKDTLNAWVAKIVNTLRGRSGKIWTDNAAVDVRSVDPLEFDDEDEVVPRDDLDDVIYVLTNPPKDGLVRNGGRWPGFTTYGWRFGETRTFEKPTWFFDEKNKKLPERVSITLKRPPGVLPGLDDDELHKHLMTRVLEREREHQARMRAENRRFMGERKIKKQRWDRAPGSRDERFVMAKRIRARNARIRRYALQRDRMWRLRYAEARDRNRAGDASACFPYGTWWMVRFAGARVERAPP